MNLKMRAESLLPEPWWLYLIECAGGTIYTGIAKDVNARFAKHQSGAGAKYTKMYPPLRILASQQFPTQAEAARAEIAMKKLKAEEKWQWARAIAAGARFAVTG